ncbi:Fc.00g036930.m01.CDS01 [Cosmosporella sp. VM-42]
MLLLKPLLLAASVAALVIVPDLSEADEDIFRALPIDEMSAALPLAMGIEVPCKQCRGRDTHLQLDFAVEEETRLMLNGFELYPDADPWRGDLTAEVAKGNGKSRERRLGYSLAVKPGAVDEDQHFEIIDVDLRVIEVGNLFVEGIPTVKVTLIKAAAGEIIIASVELDKSDQNGNDKKCTSMLCRFEKLFGDTWRGVKGSHKGCGGMQVHGDAKGDRKHPHGKSGHKNGGHKNGGHMNGDHKNGGHKMGGHHHHTGDNDKEDLHHSWGKMFKTVTSYIFLPVLMGITAGVGVAILAMFAGSIIFRISRLVRCDGCEGSEGCPEKAAVTEFIEHEEEKSGLVTNQEPPPQYEEEHPHN